MLKFLIWLNQWVGQDNWNRLNVGKLFKLVQKQIYNNSLTSPVYKHKHKKICVYLYF